MSKDSVKGITTGEPIQIQFAKWRVIADSALADERFWQRNVEGEPITLLAESDGELAEIEAALQADGIKHSPAELVELAQADKDILLASDITDRSQADMILQRNKAVAGATTLDELKAALTRQSTSTTAESK